MKAEYTVKINGKWYRAGDELPSLNSAKEVKEEVVAKEPLIDDDLPMADLRKLAKEKGISAPVGTSKAKLKEMLGM